MIISASRRTDIPTYYSEWFFNRIKEGYVLVRNPMNAKQISRIDLNPEAVDGIVFWTKNPIPMLDKLHLLSEYMYYFQFTLNAYGQDVETGVPSKNSSIIPAFQKLSDRIGPDRVIWRYDPIFINEKYTVDYHLRYFEELAKRLSPYTRKCTISFLDFYKDTQKNLFSIGVQKFTPQLQEFLAKNLAEIAHSYGLQMDTCAEGIELGKYGITHAKCIDGSLFEKLLGCELKTEKDKNQRPECGCMESIDIGAYNTCRNGCRYCYANHSQKAVHTNFCMHDTRSPLLVGEIRPSDKIIDRKMSSSKISQLRFEL